MHASPPPSLSSAYQHLHGLLAASLAAGRYTHAYAACGRLGEPPLFEEQLVAAGASGVAQYFDLASLTKALVTTPLVLAHLAQRGLSPQSTVAECWGEALAPYLPAALLRSWRVEELLAHRSGLPDWRNLWAHCNTAPCCREATTDPRRWVFKRLASIAAAGTATRSYCYSDLGFILLGLSLEEASGRSLAQLFDDYWQTLQPQPQPARPSPLLFMDRLPAREQVVPTAYCAVRQRLLWGEVHDENAAVLGGIAGHAGAFARGQDLRVYLRVLLESKSGQAMLAANASRRQAANHTALLGWHQADGESSAQAFGRGQAIGHLGFTGTSLWLVPETKAYGILLTNRVHSGRVAPWITEFRRSVFTSFQELCER